MASIPEVVKQGIITTGENFGGIFAGRDLRTGEELDPFEISRRFVRDGGNLAMLAGGVESLVTRPVRMAAPLGSLTMNTAPAVLPRSAPVAPVGPGVQVAGPQFSEMGPVSMAGTGMPELFTGIKPVTAGPGLGSLEEAMALQARAAELNSIREPWLAENGTTTAVNVQHIQTGELQTWIAIAGPKPMPPQWAGRLNPGEVFIQGPGHAEQTIMNALDNQWRILSGGTSRNVCRTVCQPLLEQQGLRLGGPVFRGMPDKTAYRAFWWLPEWLSN